MKCYVINLDRVPQRMTRMEEILKSHSIEYERFLAVDALSFTTDDLHHYFSQLQQSKPMTAYEVACAVSHLGVIRKIANGKDDFAIVMEDDLHLSDDAGEFINSCKWIPNGVDLIKLETVNEPTIVKSDEILLPNGRSLVALVHKHWGAGAYVISKSAARKVVEEYAPGSRPIDDYLFDPSINSFDLWQLRPSIAVQDVILNKKPHADTPYLASTLEPERLQIRNYGESKKIGLGQRFKRETIRAFRKTVRRVSFFWGLHISRKLVKTTVEYRK